MNLDFSALYVLWATDFFQKNEILLLCFGVIILLLLVIMIVVSINKTRRLKTLQQLNEVAEESNQLKNAFIANMTHEIRTPLNAIVGFTNVLAETDNLSREERMIFLKEINDNKNFLVQMINDLLDFSKIEANTMEYKDGDVDDEYIDSGNMCCGKCTSPTIGYSDRVCRETASMSFND